jgi:hypothetical protein
MTEMMTQTIKADGSLVEAELDQADPVVAVALRMLNACLRIQRCHNAEGEEDANAKFRDMDFVAAEMTAALRERDAAAAQAAQAVAEYYASGMG